MQTALMLGTALVSMRAPSGTTVPALHMDFANSEYEADGGAIASPLALTRSSAAWRTAADGITVTAFATDEARIDGRGLYLERARNRLSTYSTDQVNWAIVSSATRTADTAIGLLTPVIIGSGGSTASMLSSNTNISLTAGQVVSVRGVYKAGTSGRARFRVSNAAAQNSTVTGVAGALAVVDEVGGAWSNLLNTDLAGDWFGFEANLAAVATEAGYRLREGPDSAVAAQTAVFAWSQMTDEADPGEIILGTLASAPFAQSEDVASIDITSYGVTGAVVQFTSGRIATDATILRLESAGTTDYVQLVLDSATMELTVSAAISGAEVASVSLGTINARQEYTAGFEWRNNELRAYVNGGSVVSDAFVGTMPDLITAELFPSGGTNLTIPEVNFYDRPL